MNRSITDCFDAVKKNQVMEDLKSVSFNSFEELHAFMDVTHEVVLKTLEKILKRER